ncbi:MAG: tetratricopeptide repeat protein, partial [Chlorobi bacterium]|nr:tetratricopeptide repeat protein [Chlorobiota bacterium]
VSVILENAWRYYYHGSLSTAMKRFNQVWLLNPDIPDSYFGFAALTESQGNTEDALSFYKIGFEKDSANLRSIICLKIIAQCKEQLGDTIGVVNAYESIIKLQPDHLIALKKLGYFHMELFNVMEAEKALLRAIELDPEDPVSYNNMGYLKYKKKSYKSAVRFYDNAVRLDSNHVSALIYRGSSLMHLNQFKSAIPDFEKCVALIPDNCEFRRKLGLAKLYSDDTDGACLDFNIALRLGDTFVIALIKEHCE